VALPRLSVAAGRTFAGSPVSLSASSSSPLYLPEILLPAFGNPFDPRDEHALVCEARSVQNGTLIPGKTVHKFCS
jgi:hypothetical protein